MSSRHSPRPMMNQLEPSEGLLVCEPRILALAPPKFWICSYEIEAIWSPIFLNLYLFPFSSIDCEGIVYREAEVFFFPLKVKLLFLAPPAFPIEEVIFHIPRLRVEINPGYLDRGLETKLEITSRRSRFIAWVSRVQCFGRELKIKCFMSNFGGSMFYDQYKQFDGLCVISAISNTTSKHQTEESPCASTVFISKSFIQHLKIQK